MSDGVINIQVGSMYDLALDIYDYLEYDNTNQSVVSEVNDFISELETVGVWRVFTNLISQNQPNYSQASSDKLVKIITLIMMA